MLQKRSLAHLSNVLCFEREGRISANPISLGNQVDGVRCTR
jgi:hypothetical protein